MAVEMQIKEATFGKGMLLDMAADQLPDGYCSNASHVRFRDGAVINCTLAPYSYPSMTAADDKIIGAHGFMGLTAAATYGSIIAYGSKTKLYTTNNSVTAAGSSYTGAQYQPWSIDNFGSVVIATNGVDAVQKIEAGGGPYYATAAALGGSPPISAVAAVFARHVFLTAQPANPWRVSWSDIDDYETWTAAADNEAGDVDLTESPSTVVGACCCGDGLAVYTKDQIHYFQYIGTPYVFSRRIVDYGNGLLQKHLVCAVGPVNYFINKFGEPMCFDGTRTFPIAPGNAKYSSVLTGTESDLYSYGSFAVAFTARNEVWFCLRTSENYNANYALIYNYKEGTWSYRTFTVFCGTTDQYGYFWVGTNDKKLSMVDYFRNDTQVDSTDPGYFDSPEYDFGMPENYKVIHKVEVIGNNATSGKDMSLYVGTRSTTEDAVSWSSAYTIARQSPKVDMRVASRRVRFRIKANAAGNVFKITKIRIHWTMEGPR